MKARPEISPQRLSVERKTDTTRASASMRQTSTPLLDILTLSRPMLSNGHSRLAPTYLSLQRSIGNRATGRLLQRLAAPIQSKRAVGKAEKVFKRGESTATDRIVAGLPVERRPHLPDGLLSHGLQRQPEAEEKEQSSGDGGSLDAKVSASNSGSDATEGDETSPTTGGEGVTDTPGAGGPPGQGSRGVGEGEPPPREISSLAPLVAEAGMAGEPEAVAVETEMPVSPAIPTTPAAREDALANAEAAARETALSGQPEYQRSVEIQPAAEESLEAGVEVAGEEALPVEVGAPEADPEAALAAGDVLVKAATQAGEEPEGADAEAEAAEQTIEEGAEGVGAAPSPAGFTGGAGDAAGAVGEAVAALSVPMAEAARLRATRIGFAPRLEAEGADPRELQRRKASETVASGFLNRVGTHVENLIAIATGAVPRILRRAEAAKAVVEAAIASDKETVKSGIEEARAATKQQAARSQGYVQGRRRGVEASASGSANSARKRVKKGYEDAGKELKTQQVNQIKAVDGLFRTWKPRYRKAGIVAGAHARQRANGRQMQWLKQINPDTCTLLEGCYHDNKLRARADAARKVGAGYEKELVKAANKQAGKVTQSRPGIMAKIREIGTQAGDGLKKQLTSITQAIDKSEAQGRAAASKVARRLASAIHKSSRKTLSALAQQEEIQLKRLAEYGAAQQQGLDGVAAQAIGSITDGVSQASQTLNASMGEFIGSAAAMDAPGQEALSPILGEVEAQTDVAAGNMQQQLAESTKSSEHGVGVGGEESVQALGKLAKSAREQGAYTAEAYSKGAVKLRQQASQGFNRLKQGNAKTIDGMAQQGEQGFKKAETGIKSSFKKLSKAVENNLSKGRDELQKALWPGKGNKTQTDLNKAVAKHADEAAKKVQPRWKTVLKWVITIVVVIAVIVITFVSAGSLGPLGVVLLGATLGALAGAAIQVGHNLVDGQDPRKGVVKAMIVGAIGGAFGGIGSVIFKGVGSVALKIGLEAGLDLVGGVVGEVVGSVAVGESINWTNVFIGALIGAGVGAGLGIGGALKGKIRAPKVGVEAPTSAVKSTAEVAAPPPTPSKGIRGFLERTKVLAPKGPKAHPLTGPPEAPKGRPAAEAPTAPAKGRPAAEAPPTPAKGAPEASPPQRKTPDGEHKITALEDGRLIRCSESCAVLRTEYADLLATRPGLNGRLRDIEKLAKSGSPGARQKAADAAAELEQVLRGIRNKKPVLEIGGTAFKGAKGRAALEKHLQAIEGAGNPLSKKAREEIIDLAQEFGQQVNAGKVTPKMRKRLEDLLVQFDPQHIGRNPVLKEAWDYSLQKMAKSGRWKGILKADGTPTAKAARSKKTMTRLYTEARGNMNDGVGAVMRDINEVFGTMKTQVNNLPAGVQVHHLLYKARLPKEAINPDNLLLALRKSAKGEPDRLHGLLHYVSSGAGLTSLGRNRWRVLQDEMSAIISKVYGL